MKKRFVALVFILTGVINAQPDVRFINTDHRFSALDLHPDGYLLCGTGKGEILLFDGNQFYPLADVGEKVVDFFIDDEGIQAITQQGISEIKNDKILVRTRIPNITDFIKTDNTEILLLGDNILHYRNHSFQPHPSAPGISQNAIKSAMVKESDIFLSVDSTIYRYTSRWRSWKQCPFPINSLANHNGEMYAATPMGLFLINDHSVRQVVLNGQSLSIPVKQVFSSGDVLIYTTTDRITFFNTKDNTEERWNIQFSEVADMEVDPWLNYWFIVDGKLFKIQNKVGKSIPPEFVDITVRQGYQEIPHGDNKLVLEKEENDIGFDFAAIHPGYPESLVFQYRLEGKDDRWSTWSSTNSANYTALLPGNYSFSVRAAVEKNIYRESPSIQIKIKGDPVSPVWFFLGGVALSVILLTFWSQRRMHSLQGRKTREIDRLRTQNKMLSFQQKSLQLQMNPHFVFNALNSIQGLIDKDDNVNARNYLKQFSAMMRMVLNQSRSEYIELEEEIKYLNHYLSLEQMTRNHSFYYTFYIDESVEDDIKIPPMIIQPFIENAIIHGVSPLKTGKGEIIIRLYQKDAFVLCEVEDNGVGRQFVKGQRKTSHVSVAISVVEDRLQNLFKNKTGEYVTLADPEKGGFLVRLKIPYV